MIIKISWWSGIEPNRLFIWIKTFQKAIASHLCNGALNEADVAVRDMDAQRTSGCRAQSAGDQVQSLAPDNGQFTFADQGRNFEPGAQGGQTIVSGPLRGVSPIEKQRAAQINRFIAGKNASARVPITDSVTFQLEKRGANVSGKFTKKGTPGSLKFTGTVMSVKGKQEVRIAGMKWDASIGKLFV
jgi:hypothetical protein